MRGHYMPKTQKKLHPGSKLLELSVLEMFSGFDTPMHGREKANIKKWDYISVKNHCTAKETFNKINQLSKCDKTFENYLSDKRLTAKINVI